MKSRGMASGCGCEAGRGREGGEACAGLLSGCDDLKFMLGQLFD